MSKQIRIRRGLNIHLKGQAEKVYTRIGVRGEYVIYPTDFPMLTPRLMVREGDTVKAGSPLFCDKKQESLLFTSPVSGRVTQIMRGERRRIEQIVVKCESDELDYLDFGVQKLSELSHVQILEKMLASGVWPMIRQRPFNVIARPELPPRDIFISTFSSAPLATDIDFAIKDEADNFRLGLDVLSRLTSGNVHLGINGRYPAHEAFTPYGNSKVIPHQFVGPHPTGNVGVQIHHIAPIAKGEVVWTVNPLDVVIIGRLFSTGRYDARKIICVAGSRVLKPRYYTGMIGSPMRLLLEDQVNFDSDVRIISGDVLSGTKTPEDGSLHFYDNSVAVIPEGDYYEFMGWASPGFRKFSASRLFPSFLMPKRKYDLNTNLHGGERAFVISGQYERVVPMRIYPVHLIKAIMAKDIDEMEELGIYEVAEEDFALCDFVCTSKIEAQSILREGLDLMIRELN